MPALTERQQEIKTRLDRGMGAREIANDLGITRNAVYQQIQRMRNYGVLDPSFTPTGLPTRERAGAHVLTRLLEGVDEDTTASASGALALVQELRRIRDDLDVISRRISEIVPR
jgi:transposase